MKYKSTLSFSCALLAGLALFAGGASAQTKAYRQTILGSSVPGLANNFAPSLVDPWGIAFLPAQQFYISDNGAGFISSHDSQGVQAGNIAIPIPAGDTHRATPTAIVSDGNNLFGTALSHVQYAVASQDGTISGFSIINGNIPTSATLEKAESAAGAVYTWLALLNPGCCAPFVAVANFHDGAIDTFTSSFDLLAGPGSFTDPGLPPGYAPFGMQVIGTRLFNTYALQDAAKHDPVFGAGNGIVDLLDTASNFIRRFATGGALNAPWGVTQASANFGPFSNAILISNAGDGAISAYDHDQPDGAVAWLANKQAE